MSDILPDPDPSSLSSSTNTNATTNVSSSSLSSSSSSSTQTTSSLPSPTTTTSPTTTKRMSSSTTTTTTTTTSLRTIPPNNYILPFSMRFLRTMGGIGVCTSCTKCRCSNINTNTTTTTTNNSINNNKTDGKKENDNDDIEKEEEEEEYRKEQNQIIQQLQHNNNNDNDNIVSSVVDPLYTRMIMLEQEDNTTDVVNHTTLKTAATTKQHDSSSSSSSSLLLAPPPPPPPQLQLLQHQLLQVLQKQSYIMEQIIMDYHAICHMYHCEMDIGFIMTIRYTLSTLHITSINFNQVHLLSICEILYKYGNGPLSFLQYFDFSRPTKRQRQRRHIGYGNNSGGNRNMVSSSTFHVVPTSTTSNSSSSSSSSSTWNNNSNISSGRGMMNTGFGSHGAIALAKWIQMSQYMTELYLDRNPIGPYGASMIFVACTMNTSLTKLSIRRCHINERGAIMLVKSIITQQQQFYESILQSSTTSTTTSSKSLPQPNNCCRIEMIDVSANRIGYRGCIAMEVAMQQLHATYAQVVLQTQSQLQSPSSTSKHTHRLPPLLQLDMEGNLVLQEVMNSITHGLGIILAIIGSIILMQRVYQDHHTSLCHLYSCTIYSISLIVLYTSSTLYHSFFTLRHTKYVFEVIDKCAIYILIAGSYTPFLQIVLSHMTMYSVGLLCFLWILCGLGVTVEFMYPIWKYKGTFSLVMFLCMGWSALICIPQVAQIIPPRALHIMTMGGISYTAGVPFFVRNNNLDHAIWHLFVLGGSIFHWCGVYFYVVPLPIQ